jgi:hypothetical protein
VKGRKYGRDLNEKLYNCLPSPDKVGRRMFQLNRREKDTGKLILIQKYRRFTIFLLPYKV